MTNDEFQKVLDETIENIKAVLGSKGKEYTRGEDRLSNFKQAAKLQDCSQLKALGGMMAKHTVSIFDMLGDWEKDFQDDDGGTRHNQDMWDEKIFDHINYLILARAIVLERLVQ